MWFQVSVKMVQKVNMKLSNRHKSATFYENSNFSSFIIWIENFQFLEVLNYTSAIICILFNLSILKSDWKHQVDTCSSNRRRHHFYYESISLLHTVPHLILSFLSSMEHHKDNHSPQIATAIIDTSILKTVIKHYWDLYLWYGYQLRWRSELF